MSVSRRDFLGWTGGIVATAALPTWADEGSVFSRRGRFERLSLTYAHVRLGLKEPFSVLHVSDTHLTAADASDSPGTHAASVRRTQTFGGRQEEAFADTLAWARDNVDYLVHTGDLIDFQSHANLALVKKHLGAAAVAGSMGNHEFYTYLPDEKIGTDEAFKDRSWKLLEGTYPYDPRFSSTVVRGVNFVFVNDVFGTVTADTVERFEQEVRKGLPIVLCMHVPIITPALWQASEKFWRYNGKRFASVGASAPRGDYLRQQKDPVTRDFIARLRREPLLACLLTGHLHLNFQERFSPTAVQYVVGGNFMFGGEEILFT